MISGIIKAVEVLGGGRRGSVKLGAIESSSSSSESDGKLYQASSSSSVASLYSDSSESGGEESSDWPSDKSGKSNKPPKVAIIASFR